VEFSLNIGHIWSIRHIHKNIRFESYKQKKQKTEMKVPAFDTGWGEDKLSGTRDRWQ
jgi:hypothetical protein